MDMAEFTCQAPADLCLYKRLPAFRGIFRMCRQKRSAVEETDCTSRDNFSADRKRTRRDGLASSDGREKSPKNGVRDEWHS